jgi:hypothetical protein
MKKITTAILLAAAAAAAPLAEAIHTRNHPEHETRLAGSKPGGVGDGKTLFVGSKPGGAGDGEAPFGSRRSRSGPRALRRCSPTSRSRPSSRARAG